MATQSYKEVNAEEYIVAEEPFFMPTSDEIEVFKQHTMKEFQSFLRGLQEQVKHVLLSICHGKSIAMKIKLRIFH